MRHSQNCVKTMVIGDSFTVVNQGGGPVITAVTRASNVATATVSSTGGFRALNPVTVCNMLDSSFNALRDGNGLTGFRNTGGLSRRVRVLARLARLLASLHGRALAYGDLSPTNIFVSRSHEHAEVWLIDCDNISVLCREGGQKIYTREYGAPEVLRRDSGINSLTDSWSFAVIAFQI